MSYFNWVLEDLDCQFWGLVTLLCFYVNDGSVDEMKFLQQVASCLPDHCRTTVTAVPVPYLAYGGRMASSFPIAAMTKAVISIPANCH